MYDLNELEELDAAELELQHEHIMADVKKYEDEEADWRKRPQSKHKKGTRISSMLIAEHCLDVDTRQKGEDAVIKAVLSLKEVTLLRLDIVDLSNLDCMMQLQRLSLPFNRISKIDDLDLLSNLTTLILSHNQIRVIENLEALASLQVLDLSYNAIARLPSDLSQVLPASLTELDLRENPLLLDENDRTEEPEAFGYRQQVVADVAGLEMLDGVRVAVEDRHKLRPRADSHGVPPRPAPSAKPGGGAGDFDAEMRKIRAACEEEGLSTAGLPTLAEQRVAAMSTLQKAFEPPPSAAPAAASSAGGGYFAKPRTPAMDPGEDDSDFTDAPAPSHVDTRRQQLLDSYAQRVEARQKYYDMIIDGEIDGEAGLRIDALLQAEREKRCHGRDRAAEPSPGGDLDFARRCDTEPSELIDLANHQRKLAGDALGGEMEGLLEGSGRRKANISGRTNKRREQAKSDDTEAFKKAKTKLTTARGKAAVAGKTAKTPAVTS